MRFGHDHTDGTGQSVAFHTLQIDGGFTLDPVPRASLADTLTIETKSVPFDDDGSTISPVSGADIFYSGWESVEIETLPPPGDQWALTGP